MRRATTIASTIVLPTIERLLLWLSVVDCAVLLATAVNRDTATAVVLWPLLRIAISLSLWHHGFATRSTSSKPSRSASASSSSSVTISPMLIILLCLTLFCGTTRAAFPAIPFGAIIGKISTITGVIGLIHTILQIIVTFIRFTVCWSIAFLIAVVIYINVFDAFGALANDFSFTSYLTTLLLSMIQCEPTDPEFGAYREELFKANDERKRSVTDKASVLREAFDHHDDNDTSVDDIATRPHAIYYAKGTVLRELQEIVRFVESGNEYLARLGRK